MSGETDGLSRAGEDLLRAGLAWLDGVSRASRELVEAAPERAEQDGAGTTDLLMVMARAQIALATAGLDYSRRLVDLQARRAPRLGGSLVSALGEGGLSEAERRALIDEARGYMREVATATMDEARSLTRVLSDIDRTLASAGGAEGTAETPHARRWRVKE